MNREPTLACAACGRGVADGEASWKDCEPYCQECRTNGYQAVAVIVVPASSERALIERVAALHPRTSSQEGLDDGCFFCGEYREKRCTHEARGYVTPGHRCWGYWQLHQSGCVWVAARKMLDLPVYECGNSADHRPKREFPFTDALDADEAITVRAIEA